MKHCCLLSILLTLNVLAQSGGQYEIGPSVMSNGGAAANGGQYSITNTAGQPAAGTRSNGGGFSIYGGFWQPTLSPSAASVSISGRVLTNSGNGIRGVRVSMANMSGVTRTTTTSAFGYFGFDDVEAGQTYLIQVHSKRFQFVQPTQFVSVMETIDDLEFIGESH